MNNENTQRARETADDTAGPSMTMTPALAAYREARVAFYARLGYRPAEAVATANLDTYVRALRAEKEED